MFSPRGQLWLLTQLSKAPFSDSSIWNIEICYTNLWFLGGIRGAHKECSPICLTPLKWSNSDLPKRNCHFGNEHQLQPHTIMLLGQTAESNYTVHKEQISHLQKQQFFPLGTSGCPISWLIMINCSWDHSFGVKPNYVRSRGINFKTSS